MGKIEEDSRDGRILTEFRPFVARFCNDVYYAADDDDDDSILSERARVAGGMQKELQ